MDYGRIYREFIADRRAREPFLEGYTERHHILPRSLGGGNEAANLIRLTPEDHIFAHLLLARVHGGSMWAPLVIMFGRGIHLRMPARRQIRVKAKAREMHAASMSGSGNPSFGVAMSEAAKARISDPKSYELRHVDGRSVFGTRALLSEATGLTRQRLSRILTGARKTADGWFSPLFHDGRTKGQLLSDAKASRAILNLVHLDGREWAGTLRDFRQQFGVSFYLQSPAGHCQGWFTSKEHMARWNPSRLKRAASASRARGCIAGHRNPMFGSDRRKDLAVKMAHASGATFEGSLKSFADANGLGPDAYSRMKRTLLGKKIVAGAVVKSFKGWRLVA